MNNEFKVGDIVRFKSSPLYDSDFYGARAKIISELPLN